VTGCYLLLLRLYFLVCIYVKIIFPLKEINVHFVKERLVFSALLLYRMGFTVHVCASSNNKKKQVNSMAVSSRANYKHNAYFSLHDIGLLSPTHLHFRYVKATDKKLSLSIINHHAMNLSGKSW
jgi:hypothetical protein